MISDSEPLSRLCCRVQRGLSASVDRQHSRHFTFTTRALQSYSGRRKAYPNPNVGLPLTHNHHRRGTLLDGSPFLSTDLQASFQTANHTHICRPNGSSAQHIQLFSRYDVVLQARLHAPRTRSCLGSSADNISTRSLLLPFSIASVDSSQSLASVFFAVIDADHDCPLPEFTLTSPHPRRHSLTRFPRAHPTFESELCASGQCAVSSL